MAELRGGAFHQHADLMKDLLALALNEIVEQQLEGIHAQIGIRGLNARTMHRTLPSFISAELRTNEVMQLCERCDFQELCQQRFYARSISKGYKALVRHLATPIQAMVDHGDTSFLVLS